MKIIKTKNKCFDVFCNLVVMKVKCRGCDKTFSTKSNRNKHERAAGHGPSETGEREIPYDSENGVYLCPTANCITTATTKRSITRHLKKCYDISINRKRNQQNKICGYCQNVFQKKSNRDRHVKQCHKDVNDTMEEDSNALEVQSEERPTMAQFDEPPRFDEVPPFDDQLHQVQSFSLVPPSDERPAILPQCDYPVQLLSPTKDPERSSHLESIICNIKKIKSEHHYEKKITENLILKLKRDLRSKKAEAVEFIKDSFGDMLDDKDFLSWLSKKLEYKPNRLKSLLQDKAHNIRKSLQPKTYQDVYDFWLQNSINSNDS